MTAIWDNLCLFRDTFPVVLSIKGFHCSLDEMIGYHIVNPVWLTPWLYFLIWNFHMVWYVSMHSTESYCHFFHSGKFIPLDRICVLNQALCGDEVTLCVLNCFVLVMHWARDSTSMILNLCMVYSVPYMGMVNTLRPRQMDAISQTTFSNAFSWMKMFEFRLKFHWSLFPRVQLTIFQ